ncbi:hypothetical protein ACQUSR_19225 [Streptomyces sp. P1-3]|uniref:hypothetical protein n=1 Tax=Streptomyces sp. P1-3 TaxID=3421658 RepID=UPI003D36BAF7
MATEGARNLAAALDVHGGALTIQGGLVRGIIAKWGGQSGTLSQFPAKSTWSQDQAKDIRHRLGVLGADPERVLMMAAYLGTMKTWEWAKDNAEQFTEEVVKGAEAINDSQTKQDALAVAKTLSIAKGVAAFNRYKEAWKKATLVGAALDRLNLGKLSPAAFQRTLQMLGSARAGFTKPWGAMAFLANKFKFLAFLNKAPGAGALDKVMLPLSLVTGLKEFVMPSHGGVQGVVDRGMGLLQAAGAGGVMAGWFSASVAAGAIPVVGWVALGIAGAYFLGSWAWDKWGDDIKDGAKAAWNWTADKGKEVWNDTKETVSNEWNDFKDGAKEAAKRYLPGPVKDLKFW